MTTIDQEVVGLPIDDKDLEIGEKIKQIFEEAGEDLDNIKCKHYRIARGDYEWLYDATPSEMVGLHDRLRDEYGPGLYEVRVFVNGKMHRRLKLKIGGRLTDKFPQKTEVMKPDQVLDMVRHMQNNQMEQTKLMVEQMKSAMIEAVAKSNPPAPAPADPITMQTGLLTMMQQMRELVTPPQQVAPTQDPIDMLTKMLELQSSLQALTGEAGTGTMLAAVAKEVLPDLVSLAKLDGMKKRPMVPPVPSPSAARIAEIGRMSGVTANQTQSETTTTSPQQAANPTPEDEQMYQQIFLKQAITLLLPKAEQNRDPTVYAEVLLDTADDYNQEQWAIEFITQPAFVNYLVQIDPRVEPYRLWFTALRNTVIDMVTETEPQPTQQTENVSRVDEPKQQPTDGTARRGNGNTRDPQDNVAVSK
ncbi:MAG: hypothetical protein GY807_23470 [Gammaproteobacteria bacterium]|nr:hypothetical protein [Gammaproteobacteria bacterium]